MSDPKRHHYLPQFYLKGFCCDDHFWVFDRRSYQFRYQTPQNTAIQTHYYSVEDKDGEKISKIESFLADIESMAKPIIEKVKSKSSLSNEDKEILSVFISFLWNRVPDFEKSINKLEEYLIHCMADLMFSDDKRIESIIKRYEENTGNKSTVSAKNIADFYKSGAYEIKINRSASLKLMLELSPECANYFRQMDWVFFHAPPNTSFITSDNPFILAPPDNWNQNSSYGVGLITPGAKKVIPITQKVCLVMYDHGEKILHSDLKRDALRRFNIGIAHATDRFLIGRDEALVRNLVKITKLDKSERTGRIKIL